MTKKQAKPWKDMTSGERKAVLVGWVAIVAVGAYVFWPSKHDAPTTSIELAEASSAVTAPAATYTQPNSQSLASAQQYLSEVDQALADGEPLLATTDPTVLGQHSRRLSELTEQGKALFGETVFAPLGRCGVTGMFARTLWQAKVSATLRGSEATPGQIQSAEDQYLSQRRECLGTFSQGTETNG